MSDQDVTRAQLKAEHAALKEHVRLLGVEHERIRRGATSAERLAHAGRVRQAVFALERHYHRLRLAYERRWPTAAEFTEDRSPITSTFDLER